MRRLVRGLPPYRTSRHIFGALPPMSRSRRLDLPRVDRLVALMMATGFATVLFFVVYYLAPTDKLKWHVALLVAFIISVVFEISKFLFGIYLVHFATLNRVISHANAIAVLLFVFWIYLTALLFLLGGEIAKAVEEHHHGN